MRTPPRLDDVVETLGRLLGLEGRTGSAVRDLERRVGAHLGTHVVAVGSVGLGTMFTLQALGVKPGQRVVIPSVIPASTAQAICYVGGVPLFADLGDDLTLSPSDLERVLATHPDVAAVVPSHTAGVPCQVDELQAVVTSASRRIGRPIFLVYDAAEAFGATARGRQLGQFGAAEIFSLAAISGMPHLPGGVVASRQGGVLHRIKRMRNCGIDGDQRVYWPGLDGRLSDLHATLALAGLAGFSERLAVRRQRAQAFSESLAAATSFVVVAGTETASSFAQLLVMAPGRLGAARPALLDRLTAAGASGRLAVGSQMHREPRFRRFADRPLPITEDAAQRVVALPSCSSLWEGGIEPLLAAFTDAERVLESAPVPAQAPTPALAASAAVPS